MRKWFITGCILSGLASAVHAADVTFYSYGDCHYGSADPMTNWVYQINALAGTTYPTALGGGVVAPARGVIALGDLINDGGNLTAGSAQWASWKADYGVNGEGVCDYPVYECFGNHDLSSTRFVQKDVISRNQTRPGLTAISTNGLHYSWDWDGVHFVVLGMYPADTWVTDNTYGPTHDPEYALEFLKWDLATNVGDSGRPVITMHHYDFLTDWWPTRQKLAYPRELDGYNIILLLHGHQGAPYSYTWQGYTVSGQNGSLNVGRITPDNQLALGTWTSQNTWGNTYTKSITFPDLGRTWNPVPRNGHKNVAASLTQLSWRTGTYAVTQDIYFGNSSNGVESATTPTVAGLGASVSNAPVPAAFLPLQPGTEYFWRVDQHNGSQPFSKGKVWSFRTKDVVKTNDITFLVQSDIHYDELTLTANKRRLQAMNAIPGTAYPPTFGARVDNPRGVVFCGDAADDAKQWQYDYYLDDHGLTGEKLLEYPVTAELNGNHDGGLDSIVGRGIVARNAQRPYLTGLSTNGFHCSWDWDQVHCVTLGVRPGVNTNPYNSHGSLEFLIDDLATHVGNSGRAVVLFQHFGVDAYASQWWTEAERDVFYAAIKQYNVIGIFHGHTHTTSIYQWRGIDVYHAPHMQVAGSVSVPVTSNQGFFTVRITSNRLDVAEMKADGTWGLSSSKPIYLSYESSGLPAVIANGVATNGAPGQAVLSGALTYEAPEAAPTTVTIHWGTQDGGTNEVNWAQTVVIGMQTVGSFEATITGLGVSKTIYFRCRASNSQGVVWAAATSSFVTSPAALVDNGAGATELTRTSARLNGTLLQTQTTPVMAFICYGPTDGGTNTLAWAQVASMGSVSLGAFSAAVGGLSADTRYYYRCYVTNALGVCWAETSATFLTLSDRPTITTGSPVSVSRLSAVLGGFLVSTGSAPATVSVYVGTTDGGTNATAWDRSVSIGLCDEGTVSAAVTGLSEAQQYYYRFFASNAFGNSWAETSGTFTTWSSSGPINKWNDALFSTGDFNATGSGNFTWSDMNAWEGGLVPNRTNAVVSLEPRIDVANALITVDNTYTVGSITARQSGEETRFAGNGKLIFNAGTDEAVLNLHRRETRYTALRVDAYVDMQLDSDLDLRMGAARQEEATVGRIGKTISGTGALTLTLANNDAIATRLFKLGSTGANTYQGGTIVQHISRISYGAGHGVQNIVQLNALSSGAFGSGDVTLDGTGCTTTCSLSGVGASRGLWLRLSANNAIAPTAALTLVSQANIALEVAGGVSQTVAAVTADGVPLAAGTYTGGDVPWLYGTGTLIVGNGGEPPAQVPEIGVLGSNGNAIADGSTTLSQPLGTDFGEILWNGGAPVSQSFTITNSGVATLTLSGAPVTILGAHSADFTVTQPVSTTIPAGNAVTFSIACDPSALGNRTGVVSIASNDSDENPYTFSIKAVGTDPEPPAQVPEIGLLGSNGVAITNGSAVLSQPLGTDFGQILWSGTLSVTNTFAITNSGTAALTLSGAPVSLLGAHSADFIVVQPASSTVAAGSSVNFKMVCNPSAVGVRTGLVSIANNDSDENPYTFSIRATGTEPAQPPPSTTLNLSFRQGDGGAYSDTAATYIEERAPTANRSTETTVKLEEEYRADVPSNNLLFQSLIGYFNIMGPGVGQIPPGATITSATLTLTFSDPGAAGALFTIHQMLKPWIEGQVTWTQLSSGVAFGNGPFVRTAGPVLNPGGGAPGVDYVSTPMVSKAVSVTGTAEFDVSSVVQAWANGQPNYGLYIRYMNTNGAIYHSDDATTLSNRPLLTVTCTVPSKSKGSIILFYLGE
jgi:cytolysin (calcineurin-like family phosphatase)